LGRARFDPNVIPGTGNETVDGKTASDVDVSSRSAVDFSRPFIVAPAVAKDGEEKIEAWDKFQRFCFVIGTPAFLREALPSPGPPGQTTRLPGKTLA
jgi:hypothetical protein